jgi:hypothetical protein
MALIEIDDLPVKNGGSFQFVMWLSAASSGNPPRRSNSRTHVLITDWREARARGRRLPATLPIFLLMFIRIFLIDAYVLKHIIR